MDKSSIYSNPAIPAPEFLFVVVEGVTQYEENGRKFSVIEYRVEPLKSDRGGTYLFSVLYHNESTEQLWNKCRRTFRFQGYDVASAVGHWGKIYLVPSRWKNIGYATVQFVRQTHVDQARINQLERLSALDAIPWNAKTQEDAEDIIHTAMLKMA